MCERLLAAISLDYPGRAYLPAKFSVSGWKNRKEVVSIASVMKKPPAEKMAGMSRTFDPAQRLRLVA